MRNAFIILCSILNYVNVSHAQHWEGVGGGTDSLGHTVFTIYEFNSNLYITGGFGSVAGGTLPSEGLALWNGSSWIAGNTVFTSGTGRAFATYQGALHIGGDFRRINGNKYCNRVARLDSTGWMPLGSGVTNGEVRAMASYNGDLYVGGTFTIVDSTISASRIARWDGNDWHAIGTGISGSFGVYAMEVFQNELYVGGFISSVNGVSALGIARFDGTNWNPLSTGTNGPVLALFPDTVNNRLYIGGQFTIAGGVSTPTGIAYWDGVSWYPVGIQPYIPAWDLIIFDGKLYNASSQSQAINSIGDTIRYLAWFDGTYWNPVPGGIDATGNCFAIFQNELYIGGYFTYAGDSLVNGIAKWIPGSLGVGEVTEEKLPVKVVPNPAKNKISLTFGQLLNERVDVAIYNAKGDMILRKQITNVQEQVTMDLPVGSNPGMYMCKITGKGIEMSGKFVIE